MSGEANEEIQGRLRMLATVGIAVTSLALATVGFLEVQASSRSNSIAQNGQQYSVQTMSSLLSSQETAKVDYEYYLRAQQDGEQAGNALQQSIFSDPSDKALLALVQQRFETLARNTQALTPLTPNSLDGPGKDPEFPRHTFARATAGALRYQALEDAANADESAWESRGASYTAVLTLLAVALYLFGLGLAMPKRVFPVFGSVGAALLLVGVAWAGAVAASSPKSVPDVVAQEYSDGEIALETSTIGQDAAGFQTSIADFTKAIDAWPGFARAYLGRANATLASAPQTQASLIPPASLERVISDLDEASAHGLRSGLVLEQLAGSNFALALHGQHGLFAQAVEEAREAIGIVPDDPVARYSLAVSLLGTGDTSAADAAYRDAIEHTLYLDVATKKPRSAPQFEEQWVSGALSDLEALRVAKPALGPAIDRMKELVVGSVAAGKVVEPGGTASFAGVRAQILPTIAQWFTSGSTGYDPKRDVLSVQWYARTSGKAWIGVPEISGPINPAVETSVPQFSSRNLTASSIPPRCFGTGDYLVELYVGGHLAGSAATSVAYGSGAQAFIDRSLNLEVCHPPDWKLSSKTLPGFRQGFVSPDGSKGVYMIRYDLTLLPPALRKESTAQITDSLLLSTVRSSADLFPAAPTRSSAVQHQPSMGLAGSSQRSVLYQGGLGYVQCSIDPKDDAAFVTIVFGPQSSFVSPGGDLLPVIGSLAEYAYGGSTF